MLFVGSRRRRQPPKPHLLFALFPVLLLSLAASGQTEELQPLVITATRTPQPAAHLPVTVDVIRASDMATSPALVIDDVLKASAAFSLFRRTGSLMANPTAQGVSLRNVGPSGAGRTLVLLDGIPLNDPFGGWVAWTKIPRLNLLGAEIVRGGGSSAWGSSALGGTVQLFSAPIGPADEAAARAALTTRIEVGEASTRGAEVRVVSRTGPHQWDVSGRTFHTNGFWRVPADQRGPIDRRTDSEHHWAQLRWQHTAASGLTASATLRVYREDRGNGTPLQRNQTQEALLSAAVSGPLPGEGEWTAHAYLQSQEFASMFTAVNEARDAETPALDQYAVPADAAGASVVGTWRHATAASTTLGADGRWVDGETREAYFRQNDTFTRRRRAGGEQHFVGVFAQHDRALGPRWRAQFGGRVDYWRNRGGRRREVEASSGNVVRDETFRARDGYQFNPSAGLVWTPTHGVRLRTAAYRAFRVPTLNELYRPFRVGNVITEANADLAVETLRGIELGGDATIGRVRWSLTAFHNRLRDAVSNVTLGQGPGDVPGVGFVPAGGAGRQRRNLDEVRVNGLELAAAWSLPAQLHFRIDYLLSDATVRRAEGPAADLVGRRLAQVPRHTVSAAVAWQPTPRWHVGAALRHVSRAFEDDLNELALAPATTVDLRVAHRWGDVREREVFVAAENLFDATVEAGRDGTGRIDLGQPRFLHGGFRWAW